MLGAPLQNCSCSGPDWLSQLGWPKMGARHSWLAVGAAAECRANPGLSCIRARAWVCLHRSRRKPAWHHSLVSLYFDLCAELPKAALVAEHVSRLGRLQPCGIVGAANTFACWLGLCSGCGDACNNSAAFS